MLESFYKPDELARERRSLPADTYNLAHTLLCQGGEGHLFVPIRSMQYLAVLDAEEFIFVDREGGRRVEIAWQHFRPGLRAALDAPVPYEAVYYFPGATLTMKRLQGDFQRALREFAAKRRPTTGGQVLRFTARRQP